MRSSLKYCVALVLGSALEIWPIALSAPALAQVGLPPVTVQGATLEAPPPKAKTAGAPAAEDTKGKAQDGNGADSGGVPVATVGNSVTVITRADLDRLQVRRVVDALVGLPGVSISHNSGVGGLTQVRIRGAEGNQTLVLVDGVEANSTTDGEFDFSDLSAEDVERIEVIRGPMSAIYGSNAVGGVINIITRRGQGPMKLTIRTEGGSLGTGDVAASLSAGSQWAHFALSMHWLSTDGFNIAPFGSEADGMVLRSFNFTGGIKLAEGLTLDLNLRHIDKRADRDGFGLPTAPVGTLLTTFDDASTAHNQQWLGGVRLKWDTLDNKLTHELHFKYNSTNISDMDRTFDFLGSNYGERQTYGYLGTYRFDTPSILAKQSVSWLIEKETELFTPRSDFTDGITRQRDKLSVAGEWRLTFADQVYITAGVRHDDNSVFDDFTTWHLAGAWVIKSLGLRPHATVGTAVKFPGMFEQFGSFSGFTPNPDLKPEQSQGWDAGIEWTVSKATSLDVTYFHADLTDEIASSGLTVVNVAGISTREGIELTLKQRLSASLTASFAYTYLLANDSSGIEEVRRPRHAGRFDLAYTFAGGKGSANLGVAYNGTMTDNVFVQDSSGFPTQGGRLFLDPYWLVNASVSYKLQPGVELFARVENALDQHYQEVFGYDSSPITAFAGIKLTFGGADGIDSK